MKLKYFFLLAPWLIVCGCNGCNLTNARDLFLLILVIALVILVFSVISFFGKLSENIGKKVDEEIKSISKRTNDHLISALSKAEAEIKYSKLKVDDVVKNMETLKESVTDEFKTISQNYANFQEKAQDELQSIVNKQLETTSNIENITKNVEKNTKSEYDFNSLNNELEKQNLKISILNFDIEQIKIHNTYLQRKLAQYGIEYSKEYDIEKQKAVWKSQITDGQIELVLQNLIKVNIDLSTKKKAEVLLATLNGFRSSRRQGLIDYESEKPQNNIIAETLSLIDKI